MGPESESLGSIKNVLIHVAGWSSLLGEYIHILCYNTYRPVHTLTVVQVEACHELPLYVFSAELLNS